MASSSGLAGVDTGEFQSVCTLINQAIGGQKRKQKRSETRKRKASKGERKKRKETVVSKQWNDGTKDKE
jgi:hypothetical protein